MISLPSPTIDDWIVGVDYCLALNEDGYTDWRMPTLDELIYATTYIPVTGGNLYLLLWTATPDMRAGAGIWIYFTMGTGAWAGGQYSNNRNVRCVR